MPDHLTGRALRIDEALRRERLMAMLGTLFGALAVLLVEIGLYGLLSGTVAHRTQAQSGSIGKL